MKTPRLIIWPAFLAVAGLAYWLPAGSNYAVPPQMFLNFTDAPRRERRSVFTG